MVRSQLPAQVVKGRLGESRAKEGLGATVQAC